VDCIGLTAAPHFACYFNDPLLENFIVSENKSLQIKLRNIVVVLPRNPPQCDRLYSSCYATRYIAF